MLKVSCRRNPKALTFVIFFLLMSLVLFSSFGAPSISGISKPDLTASIPVHSKAITGTKPANEVNVHAFYSSEPAPMGIADYGVGPNSAYEYSTNSFLGIAKLSSLSVQNSTGYPWMGFQLNVNLHFTTLSGQQFTYWIQDVAQIDTSLDSISILDNVWNSSSSLATMTSAGISGNGQVSDCNCSNNVSFYYAEASTSLQGNGVYFRPPMDLRLEVNSTLSPSGEPEVIFAYEDGYGWQVYDTVSFPVISSSALDSGFLVNGFNYTPLGTFYDAEMIMGGPGSGQNTSDVQSNLQLGLQYFNGHNYQEIYNAYNFGSDTAEGINNVISQGEFLYANGTMQADILPGAGSLGVLYDQTQVSIVNIQSPLSSGTLYVVNSSYTSSKGTGYQFSGGDANVTLYPGTYTFYVYNSNGVLFGQLSYTVSKGQYASLSIGSALSVALTFSYNVLGGGNGYQAPVLSYISNGQQQTVQLSTRATTYYADSGSSWSVTNPLAGSTSTEGWISNQTMIGTATSPQTTVFAYTHEYLVSFSVSPPGAGSITPSGTGWYNAGGTYAISTTPNPQYFLSAWNTTSQIAVSDPSASTTSVTIDGPGNVTADLATLTISLNAPSGAIAQGSSIQVTGTLKGGGQSTALSISGVPNGATPKWSSNPVLSSPSGAQFTLTIGTTYTTQPGTFILTISASTAGSGNTSTKFILTIKQSVALTLSYSVQGSSQGAGSPVVSYMYNGVASQTSLANTPVTIYTDQNSQWSVSKTLPGSSSTERWETNQSSSYAASNTSINFVYYQQYSVTFDYAVADGGSGYVSPTVQCTEFGSELSANLGQSFWADSNTKYSYSNPLSGSTLTERWQASNSSGVDGQVTSSSTISPEFYHQYSIDASFSIMNGGSPPGPLFVFESFGVANSTSLLVSPVAYWLDAQSKYNVSSIISSSLSGERWISNSTAGVVSSQITLNPEYNHQYYLMIQPNVRAGGAVNPNSGWVDAGSMISISSSANQGWRFEYWTGSGNGSYSGNASTTTVKLEWPMSENATFYAGLVMSTTGQGSVSYSLGSYSGTLQSGSRTIYVPAGTKVTLNANPYSFLYKLDSWLGASNQSSAETSFTVSSPVTVQAQFGYNSVSIGAIITGIVAVMLVLGLLVMRRRG